MSTSKRLAIRGAIWLIGLVGGGTTLVVVLFAALVLVVLVMPTATQAACTPDDPAGGSGVVQATAKEAANSIPSNYLRLYKKTGQERNIPWNVLAGIGKIETDHGRTRLRGVRPGEENYAGAGGPMQFLKPSWDAYGDDWKLYWQQKIRESKRAAEKEKYKGKLNAERDGDGKKDRYDPADAILGASNHLRGSIGKMSSSINLSETDIRNAVHRYNPGNYSPQSNPYANDVLAQANKYANGVAPGQANYANTSACTASLTLGSGSFGQRIAEAAAHWTVKDDAAPKPPHRSNKPAMYSWGGGTTDGPDYGICCSPSGYDATRTKGFDCSALAMYAVFQASNRKITIPRTTTAIWNSKVGKKVPGQQLAPGDLVFFNGLAHMGIYWGEVNGVRWMVEAPASKQLVRFSRFDGRGGYVGAIRVTPPAGEEIKESPSVFPA